MYRIIKVIKGDNVHYEIQKRWFWFLWITETEYCNSYDGLGSSSKIEFNTQEDAQKYINNSKHNEIRQVCK